MGSWSAINPLNVFKSSTELVTSFSLAIYTSTTYRIRVVGISHIISLTSHTYTPVQSHLTHNSAFIVLLGNNSPTSSPLTDRLDYPTLNSTSHPLPSRCPHHSPPNLQLTSSNPPTSPHNPTHPTLHTLPTTPSNASTIPPPPPPPPSHPPPPPSDTYRPFSDQSIERVASHIPDLVAWD